MEGGWRMATDEEPKHHPPSDIRHPVFHGEVAERLNAAVLKTAKLARASGVRIPPSPLFSINNDGIVAA